MYTVLDNITNNIQTQLNGIKNVTTGSATITGSYISSQSFKTQYNHNFVKVSGHIITSLSIESGSNTNIGAFTTTELPLSRTYFSFLNADGAAYLAYVDTNGSVYICNYTGTAIAKSISLYSVGLEWFF